MIFTHVLAIRIPFPWCRIFWIQSLKCATAPLKRTVPCKKQTLPFTKRNVQFTKQTVPFSRLSPNVLYGVKSVQDIFCKTRPKTAKIKRTVPYSKRATFIYGSLTQCLSMNTDGDPRWSDKFNSLLVFIQDKITFQNLTFFF